MMEPFDLYSRRERARREAEARAQGAPQDPLVRQAPKQFCYQLHYALHRLFAEPGGRDKTGFDYSLYQKVANGISDILREEYGRDNLSGRNVSQDADLDVYLKSSSPRPSEVMDVVDLALDLASDLQGIYYGFEATEVAARLVDFTENIRARMVQHRMAYDIVGGQTGPRDSEELHVEVVVPALTLLHDRPRFAAAEKQFRDALEELTQENWSDAVTDANASVEVVLRVLTGFEQGQLPALLVEARRLGLFGDSRLGQLKKYVDGLSVLADIRNKESDAHGNTSDADTAWLAVHWAGALARYLVERAEKLGI